MKKFVKWLDNYFEETILVVLLIVICVLMFANTIMRYVFSSGILWADEMCRQCFIATAFIGCGYCMKKKVLMRFDTVQSMMPGIFKFIMELLVDVILAVAFLYLAICGWSVVTKAITAGTRTVFMRLPMYVVYMVAFIGYLLGALRSIQKFFEDFALMRKEKKGEKKQ